MEDWSCPAEQKKAFTIHDLEQGELCIYMFYIPKIGRPLSDCPATKTDTDN